jgi:hypothetical protein
MMKINYMDEMQKTLELTTKIYTDIKKRSQDYGEQLEQPIEDEINRGIGFSAEDGVLPVLDRSIPSKWVLTPKYFWGGISLTLQAIERAKGNPNSMIDNVKWQIESTRRAMAKEMNRLYFGFSGGRLGLSSTTISTLTVTCDGPDLVRHFRKNDKLAIHIGSSASLRGSSTYSVTSVDKPNNQFDINADPTGIADNDEIYRALSNNESSKDNTIQGLRHIVDDTTLSGSTFQGQTRTTATEQWNGHLMRSGGNNRALTPLLLNQAYDKVGENSAYPEPDIAYAAPSLLRKYRDFFIPDMRYSSSDKVLNPGGRELWYNKAKLVGDNDCPYFTIFFLTKETLEFLEIKPLSLYENAGGAWQREDVGSSPKANEFLRMMLWGELYCKAPNANVQLLDISATI